ncbi:hypothetical protein, partial [Staphylococcus epidermidis]|uniref:hypothetical protein n=1 Tax=Staphylococcus epidermidis TaxID=1282 RepID=UPI001642E7F5
DEGEKKGYEEGINDVDSMIDRERNGEMDGRVMNRISDEVERGENKLDGDEKVGDAEEDGGNVINGVIDVNVGEGEVMINTNRNGRRGEKVGKKLDNG